jgi:hypothetical protein
MNGLREPLDEKDAQIERLHQALDGLLSLCMIKGIGNEYVAIDRGYEALAESSETYPTTMALKEEIRRRYGVKGA